MNWEIKMRREYVSNIATDDYRITLKEFKEWLKENGYSNEYLKKRVENEGLLSVAFDFSVPIVAIKALV